MFSQAFNKTQKKQFFNFNGGFPGGQGQNSDNKKFYDVLEVQKDASADEIKKAFRVKAMKYHPDRGGDPEKFKEVSTAYGVLSNEEKRKMYDQFGEAGVQDDGSGGAGPFPPGFDFSDLFGGGFPGGQKAEKKAKATLNTLKVRLEDIYNGITKTVEVKRKRICKSCKGSGANKPSVKTTCGGCNGKGAKMQSQRVGNQIFQSQVQCHECQGTGKFIKRDDKCRECNGNGHATYNHKFDVDIPKGSTHGKKLVFTYEGDEYPGIKAGDLVFEVVVDKDPRFTRNGADLYFNLNISLLEALTGFETTVTHFNGKKYTVKSKPGEIINPGMRKTIKGLGMPFFENSHKHGNLHVDFNVEFPKVLDQAQKEELFKVLKHQQKKTLEKESAMEVTLSEFRPEEENTSERGGKKKKEKEQEENDGTDENGQRVNCQHQ